MIILDAYRRPTECYAIALKPQGDTKVVAVEPRRDYTAAGVIPSTFTADMVKIEFRAEAPSETVNLALRGMRLKPVGECANCFTEWQFTESMHPTRPHIPELPSTWNQAVTYYPIIYGVITLDEIMPVRGCNRSVWDISIVETRKLKNQVQGWDGQPFSGSETYTASTWASDGFFTHAIGALPVNPLRTWHRTVLGTDYNYVYDTGVVWA